MLHMLPCLKPSLLHQAAASSHLYAVMAPPYAILHMHQLQRKLSSLPTLWSSFCDVKMTCRLPLGYRRVGFLLQYGSCLLHSCE